MFAGETLAINSSKQSCSTTIDESFQIKYSFQLHCFEESPPGNMDIRIIGNTDLEKKKLCNMFD